MQPADEQERADAQKDLATQLAGIHKALLSVANTMPVFSERGRSKTVRSQLEWAASHLHEAVRELDSAATLRGGESGPSPGTRGDVMEGLKGHTQAVAIPEILGFVSSLRKSGVLRINSADESFLIQLEEGTVAYAQGDNPPEGQLLGQILVSQGALTEEQLELVLARAPESECVLGRTLLTEGLVSKEALCIALAYQVQLLFHRMYVASDAVFQFDEGMQLMQPEDIRLNVTSLLLESARTTDEEAREAPRRAS